MRYCSEKTAELVECARRDAEPRPDLRKHLEICAGCSERWEAERQLSAEFRVIRLQAGRRQSAGTRRDALMQKFARRNQRRMPVRAWAWTLSAAAALILAAFVGRELGVRTRHQPTPAGIRTNGIRTPEPVLYEASADASALSSDEFIAVPFTPPLAPGEMVRVVHADLYPEAIASLGLDVAGVWRDQEWETGVPADVVMGGDGIPRAVRFTGDGQF
jgi:hypothetical protein